MKNSIVLFREPDWLHVFRSAGPDKPHRCAFPATLQNGDLLFAAPPEYDICVVVSGRAEVSALDKATGRKQVLEYCGKGQALCSIPFLGKSGHEESARAIRNNTSVLYYTSGDFLQLINNRFLPAFSGSSADAGVLKNIRSRLHIFSNTTPRQRLTTLLACLAAPFGNGGPVMLDTDRSPKEWAAYIGIPRKKFLSLLHELEKEGIVVPFGLRGFYIPDVRRLSDCEIPPPQPQQAIRAHSVFHNGFYL